MSPQNPRDSEDSIGNSLAIFIVSKPSKNYTFTYIEQLKYQISFIRLKLHYFCRSILTYNSEN